jgi:membrane-bound lytic murein transglycosylase D
MAMQWTGVIISNPISYAVSKVKAAAIWFSFIALSFSFMSFTSDEKLKKKDSASTDKNQFKTLISTTTAKAELLLDQHPEAATYAENFLDKQGRDYLKLMEKGKQYLNMYDEVLQRAGLPVHLKYLSVIESNLKSDARSHVGALGPWQFMPEDGKRWGLKVGGRRDERKDYYKSTLAASKYLSHLYERFGDWLLVVASYNCGPNKVARIIEEEGSNNFWDIQHRLPLETRNHVKKYIAVQYLHQNGSLLEPTVEFAELTQEEIAGSDIVEISGRYDVAVMANLIGADANLVKRYNPEIEKTLAEGKTFQLRLPKDKMQIFIARKNHILSESLKSLLNKA